MIKMIKDKAPKEKYEATLAWAAACCPTNQTVEEFVREDPKARFDRPLAVYLLCSSTLAYPWLLFNPKEGDLSCDYTVKNLAMQ
jgi:hypothetical protein